MTSQSELPVRPTQEEETIDGKKVERLEEEETKEGRKISTKKYVQQPTQAEWDEHTLTHIPFRAWCPCCVAGRKKADAHRIVADDLAEDEDTKIPILAADYKGKKHRVRNLEDQEELDEETQQDHSQHL